MKKIFSLFEIFLICLGSYAKFCEICHLEYEGVFCPGFNLGYHRETEKRFNISATGTRTFQEAENFYKQKRLQLEDLSETQIRLQGNPMALPVFQTCQQVILEETKKLEEAYKRLNSLCHEVHGCDYEAYLGKYDHNEDLIEFK